MILTKIFSFLNLKLTLPLWIALLVAFILLFLINSYYTFVTKEKVQSIYEEKQYNDYKLRYDMMMKIWNTNEDLTSEDYSNLNLIIFGDTN